MKKLFVTLAIAFASLAQVATAQTRDEFAEKLSSMDMNDSKAILQVLDAAIKAHPKDADFYLRRAELKLGMEELGNVKDTRGFIADFTKAIELDNVSWRYESRSNAYALLNDHKNALADAKTALTMAEKAGNKQYIASAADRYAGECMRSQDWKGAIDNYEKSIKNSEPTSVVASNLSTMSDCAKNMKDYASALKYTDRAIEAYKKLGDKTEGLMYYNRALIKIENLNKKAEGCADLKKAASIDNDDMITDAIKKHCK